MQNSSESIRVLFFGDIIGNIGLCAVKKYLKTIDTSKYDLIMGNGENLSGGRGIIKKDFDHLVDIGFSIVTTGNHTFDKRETYNQLKITPEIIRPYNYPRGTPGEGYYIYESNGLKLCVVSLLGRVFMKPIDCPFRKIEELFVKLKEEVDFFLVDFHAEATGEKKAMGYFLDGKADAVFGTHTHVQTNDVCVLEKGELYITDVGMVGAKKSILGCKKDNIINHYLTDLPFMIQLESEGPIEVNAIDFRLNKGKKSELLELINFVN